jgi:hypothetical protein
MEGYGEVYVLDFLQLMEDYLSRKRDARSYRQEFFALMKRRTVLSEDESRTVQEAYGDADDYDPEIRLPYTIKEPELRKRVATAAAKLAIVSHAGHIQR